MSSCGVTPFRGQRVQHQSRVTVLYRFTKPGGHVAEIRERKTTEVRAIEFIIFIDHALFESQVFHGVRLSDYPRELAKRVEQFNDDGWTNATA